MSPEGVGPVVVAGRIIGGQRDRKDRRMSYAASLLSGWLVCAAMISALAYLLLRRPR